MRFTRLWLTALLLGAATASAQVARLPSLKVDLNQTSVSGLSSGGYMAVQFHVAHSAIVNGAGVIGGGPYFCARDDQNVATTICSCTGLTSCQPNQAGQAVPNLIQRTSQNEKNNAIDPTSNLSADRVWLFSGSADSVVPQPIMNALETYYKNYLPASNIRYVKNIAAEHAMPTDSFGNGCNFRGDPFINNCKFDAAGALLEWIYGSLNPKNSGALTGRLIEFDQSEFLADPTGHGMWQTGWAYVPSACEQSAQCRVHVVFHGCRQYPGSTFAQGPQGKFGDTFVKNSGYNRWADANNLVILYPGERDERRHAAAAHASEQWLGVVGLRRRCLRHKGRAPDRGRQGDAGPPGGCKHANAATGGLLRSSLQRRSRCGEPRLHVVFLVLFRAWLERVSGLQRWDADDPQRDCVGDVSQSDFVPLSAPSVTAEERLAR